MADDCRGVWPAMTDEKIIQAAALAAAAVERRYESPTSGYIAFDLLEDVMPTAIRAAAPLIRADVLATLRARIEAMPAVNWRAIVDGAPDLLRRDDVLAELDQHTQEGGDQ